MPDTAMPKRTAQMSAFSKKLLKAGPAERARILQHAPTEFFVGAVMHHVAQKFAAVEKGLAVLGRLGRPWLDAFAALRGLRIAFEDCDSDALRELARVARGPLRSRHRRSGVLAMFEPTLKPQEHLAALAGWLETEMQKGSMTSRDAVFYAILSLPQLLPGEFDQDAVETARDRFIQASRGRSTVGGRGAKMRAPNRTDGEAAVRAAAKAFGASPTRVRHLFDFMDARAKRRRAR